MKDEKYTQHQTVDGSLYRFILSFHQESVRRVMSMCMEIEKGVLNRWVALMIF
jgi:hypothetical protein